MFSGMNFNLVIFAACINNICLTGIIIPRRNFAEFD